MTVFIDRIAASPVSVDTTAQASIFDSVVRGETKPKIRVFLFFLGIVLIPIIDQ
jgi:hypothetical protein